MCECDDMSLFKEIILFHLYLNIGLPCQILQLVHNGYMHVKWNNESASCFILSFSHLLHNTPYMFRSCTYLYCCYTRAPYNTCNKNFPILSSSDSTAKHYIWFQLAVCGVECPVSNFQGSVQREWCTRLSSHCVHHITTVSQHLSTAAKYSVQHCSGSHTHCNTGQGQQLSDHSIHYTTW